MEPRAEASTDDEEPDPSRAPFWLEKRARWKLRQTESQDGEADPKEYAKLSGQQALKEEHPGPESQEEGRRQLYPWTGVQSIR